MALTVTVTRKSVIRTGVVAAAAGTAIALLAPAGSSPVPSPAAPSDLSLRATGATRVYMTIAPVGSLTFPGEAGSPKHPNAFLLNDFTSAINHVGTARPTADNFSFTKPYDAASVSLARAAVLGNHLPTVTITFDGTGPNGAVTYQTIALSDVLVAKDAIAGGTTSGAVTESVSMTFSRITYTYYKRAADGSVTGSPQTFTWDLTSGTAT